MRRFGGLIASVALVAAAGCMYGFAGGGLPPHIHTIAISTFDNQTASPDIPKELFDSLHTDLERQLGVRDAPADRADAVVRGTIVTYDADVPIGFSANPQQSVTVSRRVQLTVDVEIVDQANGHVLYSAKAMRKEADYSEGGETIGRQAAIAKIVQQIVEGVHSNW